MTKTKEKSQNSELVEALTEAISLSKGVQRKTILNRKKGGPFAPKDGSIKPKLRRAHYQHAVKMDENTLSPDEVTLLNKLRPGSYLGGHVKVILRKDRGIDIDYPIKTAAQRLKLVNTFGVINLKSLLDRIVSEASAPKKVEEVYSEE